jgi:hypothetical protein
MRCPVHTAGHIAHKVQALHHLWLPHNTGHTAICASCATKL